MAGSVNKAILIGNLGAKPKIRELPSGQRTAKLSIATTELSTDKGSDERRERTPWHTVVIFDPNAVRFSESFLGKGDSDDVEGRLQTRKWQDQNSSDRYSTEIVVNGIGGQLRGISSRQGRDPTSPNQDDQENRSYPTDLNDDIPF